MKSLLLLALLTLLITNLACSKILLQPDLSAVAAETASYQEGFAQGCRSGYVAGGYMLGSFQRDTGRAEDDEDYRLGWKQGYADCKNEFREMCREGGLLSAASLHCSDVRQQGLDKASE